MLNADKLILMLLFLIFSCGVIIMLRYFPADVRLRRSSVPLGEQIKSKKIELTAQLKQSAFFKSVKEDRVDRAIYEDLSYLRNLIIAHKGMVNSDSVISRLAERNGPLKKSYIKMLSFMRTGRVQEAEKCMRTETGTEMGKELASLLITWEQIPPEQLEEIIISYRRSIKEMNITRQKKREELISDLIYFPATLNVFLIFINFIYISYFMQQKEMFEMIF